jgi:hypothetical protein
VPRICKLYPGICLITEKKARKTSVRVASCTSQAVQHVHHKQSSTYITSRAERTSQAEQHVHHKHSSTYITNRAARTSQTEQHVHHKQCSTYITNSAARTSQTEQYVNHKQTEGGRKKNFSVGFEPAVSGPDFLFIPKWISSDSGGINTRKHSNLRGPACWLGGLAVCIKLFLASNQLADSLSHTHQRVYKLQLTRWYSIYFGMVPPSIQQL